MTFVPTESERAAISEAVERWEGAARDYGIIKGRVNPRTRMQDAMRHGELSALPMTTNRALDGYHALYATGEYLSGVAFRRGIDPTHLDLFLERPDPDEGLRLAMIVVKRIRQSLAALPTGSTEGVGASPPSPPLSPKLGKRAMALAVLQQHPDWTNERIAHAIGCARTTLSRWPDFQQARRIIKGQKQSHLRGYKDRKTGDMEAWEERDDE